MNVPDIVIDSNNPSKTKYQKGKCLGRGDFAKCYELKNMTTGEIFAGKAIAKAQLKKSQKEKISQEIEIHGSLKHEHIVGFYECFKDSNYIYLILEICNKGSLMEMFKIRKVLTEPEIKYMVKQIAQACDYLHGINIIHHNLKLSSLFLNDNMEIKVGGFGLATKSKKCELELCSSTPDYIAPEIEKKCGHSYEVDIFSLGCIVYTLNVGKSPLKQNTHNLIPMKNNEHPFNTEIQIFIQKMLQSNPKDRPTMKDVLNDPYMRNYIPSSLPVSCLTTAPKLNNGRLSITPSNTDQAPNQSNKINLNESSLTSNGINELHLQLEKSLSSSVIEVENSDDKIEDPSAIFFICRWLEFGYGVLYQLCDNSVGVNFNDATRIVVSADGDNFQYIERNGKKQFYTLDQYPENLKEKIKQIEFFIECVNKDLNSEKPNAEVHKEDDITRLPYLNTWFKTSKMIAFHLTNDTVQINFIKDDVKLILCPLMGAIFYINKEREFRKLALFDSDEEYDCIPDVEAKLEFARDHIQKLLATI